MQDGTVENPNKKKTYKTENPYMASRAEWNERYGDYISKAKDWRLAAILAMVVAIIAVCGVVYIGSQNKLIPYVVEVDKLGEAVAIRSAELIRPADHRVIRSMLARFVVNLRSVMVDAAAQKRAVLDVYALLSGADPATVILNEYYRSGKSPFKRAESETVTVEVQSVLPISEETWQVEWLETTRSRSGTEKEKARFKAVLTIAFTPPTTEKSIILNPIGLFIKQLSWSRQL